MHLSIYDAIMKFSHRTKPLASRRAPRSRTHDRERAEDRARRDGPRAAAPAPGAAADAAGAAPDRDAGLGLLRHAGPGAGGGRGVAAAAQVGRGWVQTIKRRGGRHRVRRASSPTARASGRRRAGGWCSTGPTTTGRSPRCRRPRTARRCRRSSRPGCGGSSSGWPRRRRRGRAGARRGRDPRRRRARADPRGRDRAEGRRGRGGLRAGAAAVRARAGALRGRQQGGARLPAAAARGGAPAPAPRRGGDAWRSTPRRRSRRWRATCCATASRRSPTTWWWSPRARTTRGRTSSGSGCGGCAPRWRSSGRASARRRWRRLNAAARDLGRLVGRLRDADVLIAEVVEPAAALGLDAGGAGGARRRRSRRGARRCGPRCGPALAAPEAVGFLFDLGALHRGPRLAGAVGLRRRPSGWRRRSPRWRRRCSTSGTAGCASAGRHIREPRRRGAARAAQGAEEAALRRRHARAALPGRHGSAPTSRR